MPVRGIVRTATVKGVATPTHAPCYVSTSDNKLKFIPAGSGSTEVEVLDASSTQTLTGKTVVGTVTTDAADAAVSISSDITVFTKAGSSTHTLAAPATIGQRIRLFAGSANAHVITATGLIDDGVTGGSKTTLTLASFIGASVTLVAVQAGKWAVESKNVCAIT